YLYKFKLYFEFEVRFDEVCGGERGCLFFDAGVFEAQYHATDTGVSRCTSFTAAIIVHSKNKS
ncbi:MAG: hypothetical protein Q4E32_10700, partial [Bacteroidales bacterium]|nr:hypothetical protein [Bacteroidales bacterium]